MNIARALARSEPYPRAVMLFGSLLGSAILNSLLGAKAQRLSVSHLMITALGRSTTSFSMISPLKNPLVVIIGTTGVGKSKLAVELAQAMKSPMPPQRPPNREDVADSTFSATPVSHNSMSPGSLPWMNGRVLNSDAMQVYRGLDVITNKIPPEEQEGIEHCLMGFKSPGQQYVVGEFIHDALEIVSSSVLRPVTYSKSPRTR